MWFITQKRHLIKRGPFRKRFKLKELRATEECFTKIYRLIYHPPERTHPTCYAMIAFEKAEIGLPKPHGRMVKSINSAQAEGMQLASPADSVSCVRTQSNSDAPGGVERKDGIVSGRVQSRVPTRLDQ